MDALLNHMLVGRVDHRALATVLDGVETGEHTADLAGLARHLAARPRGAPPLADAAAFVRKNVRGRSPGKGAGAGAAR